MPTRPSSGNQTQAGGTEFMDRKMGHHFVAEKVPVAESDAFWR